METTTQFEIGGGPASALPSGVSPGLWVLALLLVVAVYTELKERRIPNWLTLSGMGLGLIMGYVEGTAALWSSLGGLAIGFGFLFLFYIFGGVGGGDVKLMGAVGALMGSDLIKPTLFYTAILGALIGVLMYIWREDFWRRTVQTLKRGRFWRKTVTEVPIEVPPIAVPYGLAIAIGCLLAILVRASIP